MVDEALGVPAELVDTQARNAGEAGRAFVAALPGRAAEFLARWELRRTGAAMYGVCALVLPVVRADGTPAVLKLQALDDGDGRGAGGAARLGRGRRGTAAASTTRRRARCCWSGWTRRGICRGVESREAVRMLGGLLARLTAVPAPAGLRGLGEMPRRGCWSDVPGAAGGVAGRGGAAAAARTARRRCARWRTQPGDRLLHWDLHFGNVLAARAGAVAGDRSEAAGG